MMMCNAVLAVLVCVAASLLCVAPALAYNPDNSVAWADDRWNDHDDSHFPGYIDNNHDCTNYASACIFYGGVQRDDDWYCYKITYNTYNRSLEWDNAQNMRLYFWGKSGVSEVGGGYAFDPNLRSQYGFAYPNNDIAMIRGDVVSINWHKNSDNTTDHTEFGVGYGTSRYNASYTGDLIDQRGSDRLHAIWSCADRMTPSDRADMVLRVWHISDSFTN